MGRHRRQRLGVTLLGLIAATLVVANPAPSAAESTDKTITTTVAMAGVREAGGSWVNEAGGCAAGTVSGFEYACAFEFDISSIPSGSKVTSATLSVRRTSGCATNDCEVDLKVYTGDGQATLGDMSLGSNVASFTPNSTTKSFNVTGHVQDRADDGSDWIGYRIATGAGASKTTPQVFDMTGANRVTLSLSYVYNPVTVIVHLGGLGDGTVTSSPPGIDCGDTCTWWFSYAEPMTLTANPQNGGTFSRWDGGDCDGSSQPVCAFLVPATFFEATAIFDPISPPISQPPGATPSPTPPQLTPPPLPTTKPTGGPTGGPIQTVVPLPTDVIASDGTVITPAPPAPTQAAIASGPAPTIVGIDDPSDAGSAGGIPLPLVILLILILGGAVGGGVYWYSKRSQAPAP